MKAIKKFIPQKQSRKIIFIKNFIDDFIEALIGFFIGTAIEAIFNLEVNKAIIFIFFYIIFAVFFRKNNQKVGQDKNNFQLKNDRGIKELKKLNIKKFFERGILISCVILFNKINILFVFMVIHLFWKIINTFANYYILERNLDYVFNESKTLNS